jgi:hypothetical protein
MVKTAEVVVKSLAWRFAVLCVCVGWFTGLRERVERGQVDGWDEPPDETMGDARRQGNGIGNLEDEIKEKREKIRKLGKNDTHTRQRETGEGWLCIRIQEKRKQERGPRATGHET